MTTRFSTPTIKCGKCGTTSNYTDDDLFIKCSNPNCPFYICTVTGCYKTWLSYKNLIQHINAGHRANAKLNECYTCKAEKSREVHRYNKCESCGTYWCLVGGCTYEFCSKEEVEQHIAWSHFNGLLDCFTICKRLGRK